MILLTVMLPLTSNLLQIQKLCHVLTKERRLNFKTYIKPGFHLRKADLFDLHIVTLMRRSSSHGTTPGGRRVGTWMLGTVNLPASTQHERRRCHRHKNSAAYTWSPSRRCLQKTFGSLVPMSRILRDLDWRSLYFCHFPSDHRQSCARGWISENSPCRPNPLLNYRKPFLFLSVSEQKLTFRPPFAKETYSDLACRILKVSNLDGTRTLSPTTDLLVRSGNGRLDYRRLPSVSLGRVSHFRLFLNCPPC